MEATLVAPVINHEAGRLADQLRRDAIDATVASADVLRTPPTRRVYVFCCDVAIATAMASTIVEWAARRAGLIGVVADGEGDDRETLLAAGFDDAVTGAVGVRELAARIRSVHRRLHASNTSGRLRHATFTLDLLQRTLWAPGASIQLTSMELEVMRALMLAAGRPLSRGELLHLVWGSDDIDITERAVDNVILRLRRKLPDPAALETVRGVGFRLV